MLQSDRSVDMHRSGGPTAAPSTVMPRTAAQLTLNAPPRSSSPTPTPPIVQFSKAMELMLFVRAGPPRMRFGTPKGSGPLAQAGTHEQPAGGFFPGQTRCVENAATCMFRIDTFAKVEGPSCGLPLEEPGRVSKFSAFIVGNGSEATKSLTVTPTVAPCSRLVRMRPPSHQPQEARW